MRSRKTLYTLFVLLLSVMVVVALVAAGCGGSEETETEADTTQTETEETTETTEIYAGKVTCSGSTTVLPIAQEAAIQFSEKNPDAEVEVQGGGSSTGITQVKEGVVDIGDASRDLKDEEDDGSLVDHKIALDIIAVVVNPNVPVDNLTQEQVKQIFTGEVTNWNAVGGPDAEIVVVVRDQASGTREMFDEKALGHKKDAPVESVASAIETNSNGIMRETVSTTDNSIGYLSYGYVNDKVKAVNYDGVEPTLENAKSEEYPLSRYLHMFTKGEPTGAVKGFIDFVLSDKFQDEVVSEEYIPITEVQ